MFYGFSQQWCSDEVPAECKSVIPYTSYPNTRLGLMDEEAYGNISQMIMEAAQNCTDPEKIMMGACHILFPRCLMGYSFYLCKQTCMGKFANAWHIIHRLGEVDAFHLLLFAVYFQTP